MRIFVTGASGFLGRHVLEKLIAERHSIVAVSRTPLSMKGVVTVQADLTDPDLSLPELPRCDAVVHLAGEIDIDGSIKTPRERIEHNLDMLLSILELLRTHDKHIPIVFASTDRMYGDIAATATERSVVSPLEPYTASKIMCEELLALYSRVYDIPSVILRFDSIYGERQPQHMFISDVIRQLRDTSSATVGDLSVCRNFVYVGDAVDAIVRALRLKKRHGSDVYNIGGAPVRLSKILSALRKIIEKKTGHATTIGKRPKGRERKIEVKPFRLSTAKTRRELGWKPSTQISTGLERTVEYFFEQR